MHEIHNCYNCNYMRNKECIRRKKYDGKAVPIVENTMKLACPCHSFIDAIKENGQYIDDGLFNPTIDTKLLLQLEKIIFGKIASNK